MIAVIFEMHLKDEGRDPYFSVASQMRSLLGEMDGFISVERFQSLSEKNKFLSLSFWRDEEAVKGWRNHIRHREAQEKGRRDFFDDYRLRVVSVLRDYGKYQRDEVPDDSRATHDALSD